MKEIVERLHENRQIELAKEILESNGYKVEKQSDRLLNEGRSNSKALTLIRDTGVKYYSETPMPEEEDVLSKLLGTSIDNIVVSGEDFISDSEVDLEKYGIDEGDHDPIMGLLDNEGYVVKDRETLESYGDAHYDLYQLGSSKIVRGDMDGYITYFAVRKSPKSPKSTKSREIGGVSFSAPVVSRSTGPGGLSADLTMSDDYTEEMFASDMEKAGYIYDDGDYYGNTGYYYHPEKDYTFGYSVRGGHPTVYYER